MLKVDSLGLDLTKLGLANKHSAQGGGRLV